MKKRLYFILADENLFHPKYFLGLINQLDPKQYKVVGVTLAKDNPKKGILHALVQQYQLWGLLGFLGIGLKSSFNSILDGLRVKNHSLRSIAKSHKIKFIQSKNVNSEAHLNHLRKLKIDIIISSCGQIFKKELLNLPKIACINRHTALLPKYGGVLPVFWAMLNKEREFGVSVHYMVEKVDQGNILYQESLSLLKNNSLFRNYILGFKLSIPATIKALENLNRGKITAKFIPNEKQYFSYPEPNIIKRFKKENKAFLFKDFPDLLSL